MGIPDQCVNAIYVHYVFYGCSTEFFPLPDIPSICVWMRIGIMGENIVSRCLSNRYDISPLEGNRQLIGHQAQLQGLYADAREGGECASKCMGSLEGGPTERRGGWMQRNSKRPPAHAASAAVIGAHIPVMVTGSHVTPEKHFSGTAAATGTSELTHIASAFTSQRLSSPSCTTTAMSHTG